MNRQTKKLLNKVNKVTAYHRHGNPIPSRVLDDLVNAQLDFEESLKRNKEINEQTKRGLT